MAAPKVTVQRILPREQIIDRQLETLKAVGRRNYEQGILTPKKSPPEAAIAAKDRWWSELSLAHDEGRFETALGIVTLDQWYGYAKDIGAGRLVDGVVKREPKVHRFWDPWHPILLDILARVDPMAIVTLEDRIRKSAETIRALAAQRMAHKKR